MEGLHEIELHFAVSHSENYVDPTTGAHTQEIEGLWNHAKDFLPPFGMKPRNLGSYLSAFTLFRHVKRKLDIMKHFLISASYCFPPKISILPIGMHQAIPMQPRQAQVESDDDFVYT